VPLGFRAKNICCCRCAFAQKTFVAAAALSHKKHLLLPLRFRTKNICRPKHKADYGRNYAVAKLIVVDQALPYFQLIVYKFNDCADDPSFKI